MIDLATATAVVTGGGSGIGLALVHAFAESGSKVVVADIDGDAARSAASEAEERGVDALAMQVDVSDAKAVDLLADAAYSFAGRVDVLCNNAGVLLWGGVDSSTDDDWRWVLDVNLMGVVNGVRAFLPRLREQGTAAHIVNTASSAAMRGNPHMAPYSASKSAVVALTESLHAELVGTPIAVTALCPSNIESRILDAQRSRPPERGPKAPEPMGTEAPGVGIGAEHVAAATLAAIRGRDLYAFAFPADWGEQVRAPVHERYAALLAAIDRGGVAR